MRSIVLIVTILLCIAGNCRAQNTTGDHPAQGKTDSAAIAGARAAFKITSRAPDSALAMAEKYLVQAQHTGDKRLAAYAYKARGWAWMRKGSYEKTFPDLQLAAKLFRELNDIHEEVYTLINLGLAYSNHTEFTNSAKYLFIADSLAQQLNDPSVKGLVSRQMGILYREQGQYRKAIPYFREGMELYLSLHDTLHFFDAAGSLAIVYIRMKLPDSSLQVCNIILPYIEALQGAHYQKAITHERFGDAWFDLGKYDKALDSYMGAYKIFAGDDGEADKAFEALNVGKTLVRLKKYREAENYLLLGYKLNDSLQMTNYSAVAAEQLAFLYQATGDWRKGYQWLQKENELMDTLQLASQNEKVEQLQAQYEADKKEKEITLLKKDQQLTLAVVGRQKVIRNAAIALVLLSFLIGILVVNRYRIVHRARRLIELEKMRNTIARDLHDDMGSALSSINIISKVALTIPNGDGKVNEHLVKIHEHSGLILENMNDIVWTINPVNDTLEKVIFKMKEFASDIFDPLNIDHSFDETGDFSDIKLGIQTRRDLYLIFKEAVNNTAKYSRCTKVAIIIVSNDKQIHIQVKDNGLGFCRDTVRNGNGLKNMEERARQMNGELTIASRPGEGTEVILRVRSHD
jgi:signal transduction histidine kinase